LLVLTYLVVFYETEKDYPLLTGIGSKLVSFVSGVMKLSLIGNCIHVLHLGHLTVMTALSPASASNNLRLQYGHNTLLRIVYSPLTLDFVLFL
jgi:hypothetical protein